MKSVNNSASNPGFVYVFWAYVTCLIPKALAHKEKSDLLTIFCEYNRSDTTGNASATSKTQGISLGFFMRAPSDTEGAPRPAA